jgi:hypothetical protein
MKEQMIKDLSEKVDEVQQASEAVVAVLVSIEDLEAVGMDKVTALVQELESKQEALLLAQDLSEAKQIKQQINSLQEDIELQRAINAGSGTALKTELEDKAVAFFDVHKSAKSVFQSVDNYILINTCLSDLKEAKETMQGYAWVISSCFARVRATLLDTSIVALNDQNITYRGIHLGQRELQTGLYTFECKVRSYLTQLRAAGFNVKV